VFDKNLKRWVNTRPKHPIRSDLTKKPFADGAARLIRSATKETVLYPISWHFQYVEILSIPE
jgi:hypothetical protein